MDPKIPGKPQPPRSFREVDEDRSRYHLALSQTPRVGTPIPVYSIPDSRPNTCPVFMVWDHENIRPPVSLDGRTLIANIENGLKIAERNCFLWGGVCYGSLTHFSTRQYCDIVDYFDSRMQLLNIPRSDLRCKTPSCLSDYPQQRNDGDHRYRRETDQADSWLIEHMLFYANDMLAKSVKPTILVMSSDADFVTATKSLLERECRMFVCVSRPTLQGGFNPIVVTEATNAWYWDQLQQGNGPTPLPTILRDLGQN